MNKTSKFLKMIASVRLDRAAVYNYDNVDYVNNSTKIKIGCSIHGEFEQRPADHRSNSGCPKCGKLKAVETNLIKYGTTNPSSSEIIKDKIRATFIEKYNGIDNPSKVASVKLQKEDTCLKNYGVKHPWQSSEIQSRKKLTNIDRYGFSSPMKNKEISAKAVATKIANGGFDKSNSSKEATEYIQKYIQKKSYNIDQCAYADHNIGLHEWGIYKNGRWILYDLVVFEAGCRGDKTKIIEIFEYHGPFHYNIKEVALRGEDKAYPWKTNNTTIKESYDRDIEKEIIGREMTSNYNIVWSNQHV